MTESRREALEKIKDSLEFQVLVCEATNTKSGSIPLSHALYLCNIINELLENNGTLNK